MARHMWRTSNSNRHGAEVELKEKIFLLKSSPLFGEIAEADLAELASLLEEEDFQPGKHVFVKDDLGDCMYLIVHGRVRVHDGELTLNLLGKREVFGEMAVFDPEPRSATVTTLEPTRLLRLGRKPLMDLLATHGSLAQGIILILSHRLRARMKDMAEDYEYMQQFDRVTAAAVAVEAGVYEPETLDEVAQRIDELGQLARVFQRMVSEVYSREQRLKQEVAELRIEIDESRKASQVAEITDTDYFQDLKKKAQALRSRHNPSDSKE
jgi:CRP/FNR family cyclic AMP-dependent transcriptional regulator